MNSALIERTYHIDGHHFYTRHRQGKSKPPLFLKQDMEFQAIRGRISLVILTQSLVFSYMTV